MQKNIKITVAFFTVSRFGLCLFSAGQTAVYKKSSKTGDLIAFV